MKEIARVQQLGMLSGVGPPPHHRQTDPTAAPLASKPAILVPVNPTILAIALLIALIPRPVVAQQSSKPDSQKSAAAPAAHDHSAMNDRGETGMGFSPTTTTHHFLLKPNGGIIQVEANDPNDRSVRDSIRAHLSHITHAFSAGDFDTPMFVHHKTPPGVPQMTRLKDKITYTFKETPAGARVVIGTADPDARAAIHQFLRFQIEEHQTHDPTTVR
jgi:hypothetical protein